MVAEPNSCTKAAWLGVRVAGGAVQMSKSDMTRHVKDDFMRMYRRHSRHNQLVEDRDDVWWRHDLTYGNGRYGLVVDCHCHFDGIAGTKVQIWKVGESQLEIVYPYGQSVRAQGEFETGGYNNRCTRCNQIPCTCYMSSENW
jgi:hypothetical protein